MSTTGFSVAVHPSSATLACSPRSVSSSTTPPLTTCFKPPVPSQASKSVRVPRAESTVVVTKMAGTVVAKEALREDWHWSA